MTSFMWLGDKFKRQDKIAARFPGQRCVKTIIVRSSLLLSQTEIFCILLRIRNCEQNNISEELKNPTVTKEVNNLKQ